ncbi:MULTISPECIES: (2Fe-2S) ferredoxin domain-containing protein [unclassified Synechococcus]|jgi:(2Fe-2S) ferredoxin|uniref:(2Fe-2S) ferredoxin domain-containing protein n=1 Tax=unclassified Synechococcus TaxID=2626047 RepID=UPI0028CDC09A|nr:hypothetical protein [Cyanobacteriota bacterium PSP.bin.10]
MKATGPPPVGYCVAAPDDGAEGIPAHIDCLGPLLYELFQERWAEIQLGHGVEGGVLELAFEKPTALCMLYDGYLTVATETWHLHLCLEEHQGGPYRKTPPELRRKRWVSRAALYRRLNPQNQPRRWGIQTVCRSSRCYPSRNYQPVVEALESARREVNLDVPVITSGCLEVCQQRPVVFYSGDRTWYKRVTPPVAGQLVHEHLLRNCPLKAHLFPGD